MNESRRLNWRALVSLTTALSFAVVTFSGCVLYATPKGRVANWSGWTFWGLMKEEWSAVHINACVLLVVFGLWHVYLNWRALWRYLTNSFGAGLRSKRELGAAVVLTVLFLAGTLAEWPPFSTVIATNARIQDYWEAHTAAGPYPHAELSPLSELAQNVGAPLDQVVEQLRRNGFEVENTELTVEELAGRYGVAPADIFTAMKEPGSGATAPRGGGAGSGSGAGLGRTSLDTLCGQYGVSLESVLERLSQEGISATGASTVRDIAPQLNMTSRKAIDYLVGPTDR